MRFNFILIILMVNSAIACFSQTENSFPTDTSFATYSTYQKEVKNYPFITIAQSITDETVIRYKDVEYARYGDRTMHIDLYLPSPTPKGKRPAVLLIHGGGWRSGNKAMEAPMATFLASKGFICATVEYRLSTETLYPAAVIDLKTAIRWLRKNAGNYSIDTTRIAAMGCSSGGQLAALLGATNGKNLFSNELYPNYSSDLQAVIDIDGILAFIHPESGEGADKPDKPSAATLWFGGTKDEKPEIWKEASALTHAGKTFPPVLFINSQYPRFHSGRDDLIARLDSLNIYSEVHQIENSPHPFWLFNPWFEPTANWCLQFLTKQFNP
jgi:acetyl esterase/lipase